MRKSRSTRSALLLALWVGLALVTPASAQRCDADADTCLLLRIHRIDSPVATGAISFFEHSAYPTIIGIVPAMWAARAIEGKRQYDDAYRLTLAVGSAYLASSVLKRVVSRQRPYETVADVQVRSSYAGARGLDARASFPSGHAALAAAIAVSGALSHPKWWVIAPASIWAAGVGVSRVWLGVHYPSDVVAGFIVGASSAALVHLLRETLQPAWVESNGILVAGPAGFGITLVL